MSYVWTRFVVPLMRACRKTPTFRCGDIRHVWSCIKILYGVVMEYSYKFRIYPFRVSTKRQ